MQRVRDHANNLFTSMEFPAHREFLGRSNIAFDKGHLGDILDSSLTQRIITR